MSTIDRAVAEADRLGMSYGQHKAMLFEKNGCKPAPKEKSERENVRRCVICGIELLPETRRTTKTCGGACSFELNRRRNATRYRATRGVPDEIIKKCPRCGEEFTTTKNNQVYCSRECQQQRDRHKRKGTQGRNYGAGVCAFCGKQYTKKAVHQVWCTVSCKKKANRRKVTKDAQTLAK